MFTILRKYIVVALLAVSGHLFAQDHKFSVNIMWSLELGNMATFDRSIIQSGEETWFLNQIGGIHVTYRPNDRFEFLSGFRLADREFKSNILFSGQGQEDFFCVFNCNNFTPYTISYQHRSLEVPFQLKYFPITNRRFVSPYLLAEPTANFLLKYDYRSSVESQLENREFPSRGFWGASVNTGLGISINPLPRIYFNLETVARAFNFQKVDKVLAWNREEQYEFYNPLTLALRGYLGFRF